MVTHTFFKDIFFKYLSVFEFAYFKSAHDIIAQILIKIVSLVNGLEYLIHLAHTVPLTRKSSVLLKAHLYYILNRESIGGVVPLIVIKQPQYSQDWQVTVLNLIKTQKVLI